MYTVCRDVGMYTVCMDACRYTVCRDVTRYTYVASRDTLARFIEDTHMTVGYHVTPVQRTFPV